MRIRNQKLQIVFFAVFFCVVVPIVWFVIPNLALRHPLYLAVTSGDVAAVKERLAQHPSELEYRFFSLNATPLHIAAEQGDTKMIELLLSAGADIEADGYRNLCTPLHIAVHSGKPKAVVLLLDQGAKVDSRDRDKMTPLHYAANIGDPDVIRTLVLRGADINAEAPSNTIPKQSPDTPISRAVESRSESGCRTILELGAKADFPRLHKIVEDQRSAAPLASKAQRDKWNAIDEILREFQED